MKIKSVLLRLCLLVLVAGLAALYMDDARSRSQAAALRAENEELKNARAAADQSADGQLKNANVELERLRKDNQELLLLRNEVHQLRDEKTQLERQVQSAQTQAQAAHAQAQNAQSQLLNAQAQSAQSQAQAEALRLKAAAAQTSAPLTPEQQALVARNAANLTPEQAANVCINYLREIDGAMQQWALESKKNGDAVPTAADIAPFFQGGKLPSCPSGGIYTLGKVREQPVCSIPGHALPR